MIIASMSSTQSLSLLADIGRLVRKRFEQRAQSLGLTRVQWRTLAYLSKNEGIHQGGLAELLEIEPITLVRVLDKLGERGFIERRRHPTDRRIWLLYLREEVRPLLDEIHALADATRAEALKDIAGERLEETFTVLSEIKNNLVLACEAPIAEQERKHD